MTCLDFLTTKMLNVSDIMYADDTVFVACNKNSIPLEVAITSTISSYNEWCRYNKLSINATKTKMMIFTNRAIPSVNIALNGLSIQCVDQFKYLGVWLDSKLRYQPQLDSLHGKLSHYCGMSIRLGHLMSIISAKSFYFAFIFSTISYCILVWGGIFNCSVRGDSVLGLQRRIILNLFSKYFPQYSYGMILQELQILKANDMYKLKVGCFMYRLINNDISPSLSNYLNLHSASHGINTRHRNDLIVPFPSVENIRLNFKYQFISVWNLVPQQIKNCQTLSQFKNAYKKYLLSRY